MRRLLHAFLLLLTGSATVLTAVLWIRSMRALDVVFFDIAIVPYGLEIRSSNGVAHLWFRREMQLKPGVADSVRPDFAANAFDVLEDQPRTPNAPWYFYDRYRWPLDQTEDWESNPRLFGGVHWQSWIGFDRDGPGKWSMMKVLQLPYWLIFVIFALAETLLLRRWLRRRKLNRPGRGFDPVGLSAPP
jgi:hypothetical protein